MINLYCQFLPNSTAVIFPLTELLKSTQAEFLFLSEAVTAFKEDKTPLPDCSTLAYQISEATLTLSINTSQIDVGGVLE